MTDGKKRKISKVRVCDACRRRKLKCDIENSKSGSCTRCIENQINCTFDEIPTKKYKDLYQDLDNKYNNLINLMERLHPGIDVNQLESINDSNFTSNFDNLYLNENYESTASKEYLKYKDVHDPRILGHSSALNVGSVEQIRQLALGSLKDFKLHQRDQFWKPLKWNDSYDGTCVPPDDLINDLIDIYFDNTNLYRPILHRRTFEEDRIIKGDDDDFLRTLYLVCAIGSRLSDDSRVLDKSEFDENNNVISWHSAGWPFFLLYLNKAKPLPALKPTLADLQQSALAAVYLLSNPQHSSSWSISTQAIVLSKDIGLHIKTESDGNEVQSELRRRVLWNLYQISNETSTFLGRESVDDKHIKVPRPSPLPDEVGTIIEEGLIWFNSFLNLIAIARVALDTLYDNLLSKYSITDEKVVKLISELDYELDKWLLTLPKHLQWSDDEQDSFKFTQRCCLMVSFYFIQTFIHRPFVGVLNPFSLSSSSTSICLQAGMSLSHICKLFKTKSKDPRTDTTSTNVFSCLIALFSCKWTLKLKSNAANYKIIDECIDNLHDYIKSRESRFYVAGRLSDIIEYLKEHPDEVNHQGISMEDVFNIDLDEMLNSSMLSANFFHTLPSLTDMDEFGIN